MDNKVKNWVAKFVTFMVRHGDWDEKDETETETINRLVPDITRLCLNNAKLRKIYVGLCKGIAEHCKEDNTAVIAASLYREGINL